MQLETSEFIWKDGEMIPWAEATVHVLTHGLHYGTSFFEGIRSYETPAGPCIFRLEEHVQRLFDSAKIYGIKLPFARQTLVQACRDVVSKNGLNSAYIRPIAYIGYGEMGPSPADPKMEVAIAAFPWAAYLGAEGQDSGVDVCVSSWRRAAPDTIPTGSKAGGNYLSSYLIGREARARGFSEGIGLGIDGLLSEGAGENLFVIREGILYTPPAASSILEGITRKTVITLAGELGLEVREQALPREMLYVADEAFLTGTAAEITPIRSVDGISTVAEGRGPITERIQKAFFEIVTGKTKDSRGWLAPVGQAAAANEEKVTDVAKIAV